LWVFFRRTILLFVCIAENVKEDNLFYIISPKDVVVARPRDMDDHITWLIRHEDFEVYFYFLLFFCNI
jgi:hypothetical protein